MKAVLTDTPPVIHAIGRTMERAFEASDLRGRFMVATSDDASDNLSVELMLNGAVEDVSDLTDDEIALLKLLTRPKKQFNPAEAQVMRDLYDWANVHLGVFKGLTPSSVNESAAAHKAWVTTREWEYLISVGRFTHDVRIEFDFGQTYADRAVSLDHAKSLVRRAKAKHRRDFEHSDVRHSVVTITPIGAA